MLRGVSSHSVPREKEKGMGEHTPQIFFKRKYQMNAMKLLEKEFPEVFTPTFGALYKTIFREIEIAEEEIAKAKKTCAPEHREAIQNSFRTLQPRNRLFTEKLFRAHCQEMIRRHVEAEDVRPGTKAEVLLMLWRPR